VKRYSVCHENFTNSQHKSSSTQKQRTIKIGQQHHTYKITCIVSVVLHDVILHTLLLDELFFGEPIDRLNGTPVEKLFGNDVDGVVDGGGPGAAVRSVAYVLREL